ncbi:MAG: DUF2156 domain-containing protein [Clostridia bacterium]|nr:DUF2156 domain-containing protein [Clostridia bacterium]
MSSSIDIKPVTMESKPLLDSYFRNGLFLNSELTFTNMFIWQPSYNIRYAEIGDTLCIFSKYKNEPESVNLSTFSGNIQEAVSKLLEYFNEISSPPLIRLFSKEQKTILSESFPGMFRFEKDPDSYDYVYNISDLINLSGSKYHAKRNHINKFKSLYNYQYHTMTPEYREACREMFCRWCESKKDSISNIGDQLTAVNRLLDNWESLDIAGGCITVDGQMVAFSFGEVLCYRNSIAVIHLEHADTDFQGSFPMINQQFLEHQWSDFKLVNREEDMGLEGLRKAKKSYYPVLLTEKYTATLK